MSLLPEEVNNALGQLLQGLGSSDNTIRSHAEDQLNNEWTLKQPDVLLMGLVEQIAQSPEASTRSFAAVLFRRISSKTRKDPTQDASRELFLTLPDPQRTAIRTRLLEGMTKEQLQMVRNKIGDAVAEIARQYADDGEHWPELLGVLFQASQATDVGQREGAFRIFATTPTIIERQHEDIVLAAFNRGFKDQDVSVRLAAMEAFASFFRSIGKKAQIKYYPLIPEILNILPPLKEAGDGEQLSRALMALIDLAEVAPRMFRHLFNNLVKFSIMVIQDKELGDQTRQNALELMATFADYAPQMCKKDESYITEMVTQCLSLMTDIGVDDDDAKEWCESEDLDVEESDLNHVAGEQCMDRLANKLGGQTVLPPTFNWLPQMVTSTAWRDRHAALMAISAISEGCRQLMEGELDKVLQLVIPALQDPHPRVRWAGCNALGQMSTDFAGLMQEKYHQTVLTNIIPVLESTEPRVQSHAAAALVNFCEEAETTVLEPYLDNLLNHLLILLRSPKRYVQEQALSTIATVADSAEAAFGKYYEGLMPLLFNVLRSESEKEYRLLRAKAMECATLIALAVGKDQLGPDAITLVQLLGAIQQNITDADDPQTSYLMHCWGRMCRVLGADFLPYLQAVMPPLMELASTKADIQLLDDEEQVAQVEQEEGWELVPLKGKVIGIKTTTLDDKHMAIELIVVYAQVLEAAFDPYVDEIMTRIAIPGLAFFFHDPVRVASAKAVPQLLNSRKLAQGVTSPGLSSLWSKIVTPLLEVLSAEPAVDTLAEMYQCFYESIEVLGANCLSSDHMAAFIESAKSALEDYQTRVKQRAEERAETTTAADGEAEEELSEETLFAIDDDQTLLSDMNKAFHTIFKHQGSTFLAHWERLLPFYDAFITSSDPTQRQWALCIMDDVLEFTGEHSHTYASHIVQPLIDGMRDDVPANRQAASYGVGIAAHKGGPAWADFAAGSLPSLVAVTRHAKAREEDHVYATENACAAIAKVLHYNASKVANVQEVVIAWIDTLPVVNDEEAAPYAYSFLVELIEQQNPAVIQKAVPLFRHVAEALAEGALQGQTAKRVMEATKRLLQFAGVDLGQAAAGLSEEQKKVVASNLS